LILFLDISMEIECLRLVELVRGRYNTLDDPFAYTIKYGTFVTNRLRESVKVIKGCGQ